MKLKLFVVITMLLMFSGISSAQEQELSSSARQFRTSILSFLREEGFTPTLENDGKQISFKREGENFWIDLSGSMPVQASFHIGGFNNKDVNFLAILLACNTVNKDKYYVKAYCTSLDDDGSTNISIELPCHTAEDFKYVFFDCVKSLVASKAQLQDEYNEAKDGLDKSNKPFEITSCTVANVDNSNKIINGYGSTIYSYQTKYLKPKIEIKSDRNGTYTINYKFFTPGGQMSTGTSSPSGYSSSAKFNVKVGTYSYEFLGWGSNTSGNWKSGDYRLEFYVDGISLGYYNFTIK